jgi:hypothetical protein
VCRKAKRGQSGNPGGRPRILRDIQEIARQKSPGMLDILADIAHNAQSQPQARVAAARELLDRGYGRLAVSESTGDHAFPWRREPLLWRRTFALFWHAGEQSRWRAIELSLTHTGLNSVTIRPAAHCGAHRDSPASTRIAQHSGALQGDDYRREYYEDG